MKSIRENVFESNSSSMHSITVATSLKDQKLYKDYVCKELERFKQQDGSYKVVVECKEKNLDKDFAIRRYIPHYSINDKLIYLLATYIQHYSGLCEYPPISYDKKADTYQDELENYLKLNLARNTRIAKSFESEIKELEDYLGHRFKCYLGEDSKISVKFKYSIDKEKQYIRYFSSKSEYFSTGCYGNEEFFHSLRYVTDAVEWICNPYSAILAGTDEASDEDMIKQEQDSKRLIEEAFEHSYKTYEDIKDYEYFEDIDEKILKQTRLNQGKVIWPLGG